MKDIIKLAGAALICFFGCWLMFRLFNEGFYPFGFFIGAATCFVVMVMLQPALAPWRWLAIGIIMALLFTIFPIIYTVYLSFTNMGPGHLLTKAQTVKRLSQEMYTPEGDISWEWIGYRKGNNYMLLLNRDGTYYKIKPGELSEQVNIQGEPPARLDGYDIMGLPETMQNLSALGALDFGEPPEVIKVISLTEVAVQLPCYTYDINKDTFTDNRTGEIFSPIMGTYTSDSGNELSPGYIVSVGINNYVRFLSNTSFLRPVGRIIIWNICFSLFSVLISFALGMVVALLFEDLKFKRIIRTLLIIPYPIPVLVSIMIWRALLNDNMGLITTVISTIFGSSPRFFVEAYWTRFALIILNVYLSYPYFYVLSSGALKSIPGELLESASIDGASSFTAVRKIIIPLVMRILAPLVIASFCFNFNNFTLVWGFNSGLPPMADAAAPMGHTDLLISFIYRLAFNASNVPDYGFSAAITVLLFILVSLMVVFQTWNTKTIKEAH